MSKILITSMVLFVLSFVIPELVWAQSAADEAVTALGDAATAVGLIAAAMVTVAAAGIVGKWVVGFIL